MAADDAESRSSSDEESNPPIVNGSKPLLSNGTASTDVVVEEVVDVGMQCGIKNLYSGKEDKVCLVFASCKMMF